MRLAASSPGRGRLRIGRRILRRRRRVPSSRIYVSVDPVVIPVPPPRPPPRRPPLRPRHPRRLRRPVHPFPQRLVVHAQPQHPREHAPEKRDGLAQRPPEQRIVRGLRVERVEERAGARDAARRPVRAAREPTGRVMLTRGRDRTRRRRRRRRRGALQRGRRREHRAKISGARNVATRDAKISPEIEIPRAQPAAEVEGIPRFANPGMAPRSRIRLIGSYLRGKSSGCGCEPRKSHPACQNFTLVAIKPDLTCTSLPAAVLSAPRPHRSGGVAPT